jgi:hypothetical protein
LAALAPSFGRTKSRQKPSGSASITRFIKKAPRDGVPGTGTASETRGARAWETGRGKWQPSAQVLSCHYA